MNMVRMYVYVCVSKKARDVDICRDKTRVDKQVARQCRSARMWEEIRGSMG